MPSQIVIDTNVFIGALLSPQGKNRDVLRHCFEGHFLPLMGNALFCEYEDVLTRKQIVRKCPLSLAEQQLLLASFMHICKWVKISYLWRPNLQDEKDNHLIELAVAGNAKYLVTHNLKDFQQMELSFPGLRILTPHQLLKEA